MAVYTLVSFCGTTKMFALLHYYVVRSKKSSHFCTNDPHSGMYGCILTVTVEVSLHSTVVSTMILWYGIVLCSDKVLWLTFSFSLSTYTHSYIHTYTHTHSHTHTHTHTHSHTHTYTHTQSHTYTHTHTHTHAQTHKHINT